LPAGDTVIIPEFLSSDVPAGTRLVGIVASAAVLGVVAHALIFRIAERLGRRVPAILVFDGALLRHARAPARMLFPLLAIRWSLPFVDPLLSPAARTGARDVLQVLLIGVSAWVLIALTRVLDDVVVRRFDISVADNLRARRVRTQVGLLRRVLVAVVVLLAVAAVLMRFDEFQTLGTTLLASTGFIGIFVSIAAQRPLGNLIAGIQLALTQPIRVDDAVVVEGEWGMVEEITLTYVVVRIWDQRRLVLPISHFFEHPFQNWTRSSTQVVGTVFLHVDYMTSVSAIRTEYERIVRASPLWDRQICALQVTDATERTIDLRGIMSTSNAGRTWDLRCEVRERLVEFLQRAHPESLPRIRLDTPDVSLASRGESPPTAAER
jgi:small-conductance mechanosensitive channel